MSRSISHLDVRIKPHNGNRLSIYVLELAVFTGTPHGTSRMSWHVFDIVTIEATVIKTQIKSKISNITIL